MMWNPFCGNGSFAPFKKKRSTHHPRNHQPNWCNGSIPDGNGETDTWSGNLIFLTMENAVVIYFWNSNLLLIIIFEINNRNIIFKMCHQQSLGIHILFFNVAIWRDQMRMISFAPLGKAFLILRKLLYCRVFLMLLIWRDQLAETQNWKVFLEC